MVHVIDTRGHYQLSLSSCFLVIHVLVGPLVRMNQTMERDLFSGDRIVHQ